MNPHVIFGTRLQLGVVDDVSGDVIQPQEESQEKEQSIIGPDGQPLKVTNLLALGYERFNHPNKHYRLIWLLGREAWLCEEDRTEYRTVHGPLGAVEAGQALAEKLGVRFREATR